MKFTGYFLLLFLITPAFAEHIKPTISGKYSAGDTQLYIECFGEPSSTTIIVHSGFNAFGSQRQWGKVVSGVSPNARICLYDRANSGKSDSGLKAYSYQTSAKRLNTLLQNAGIEPPFIMVGHSFGSYPVKFYNHLFPAEVAGIMLVDSSQYGMWYNRIAKWQPSMERYSEAIEKQRLLELEVFNNPDYKRYNPFGIDIKASEYELKDTSSFGDKPFTLVWAKGGHDISQSPSPDSHPDVWFRMASMFERAIKNMHTQLSTNTSVVYSTTPEHDVFVHDPDTIIFHLNSLLKSVQDVN